MDVKSGFSKCATDPLNDTWFTWKWIKTVSKLLSVIFLILIKAYRHLRYKSEVFVTSSVMELSLKYDKHVCHYRLIYQPITWRLKRCFWNAALYITFATKTHSNWNAGATALGLASLLPSRRGRTPTTTDGSLRRNRRSGVFPLVIAVSNRRRSFKGIPLSCTADYLQGTSPLHHRVPPSRVFLTPDE